jgi:alpha/beta superfamily hydrolase
MPCLYEPDALVVESIRFAAGPNRLEGELVYGDAALPLGAAVLAGPHPLLGGNMHNNVVRGLGDGLARHGMVTLRFNYRGVGGSEGPATHVAANLAQFWQTSRAPDEASYQEDLSGAVGFLRSVVGPDMPLALVGYSFGCTLLPGAAATSSALVLVAPTVGTHEYTAYCAAGCPKLVIAPEGDFAAEPAALARWFDALPAPKELVRPRLDSHFFRGHEHWLLATVGNFLSGEWR